MRRLERRRQRHLDRRHTGGQMPCSRTDTSASASSIALRSSPSVVLARLKSGRGPVSLPRGLVVVRALVEPAGFPPSLRGRCSPAWPRRRRVFHPLAVLRRGDGAGGGHGEQFFHRFAFLSFRRACAPETGPRPGFAPSWLGRCPGADCAAATAQAAAMASSSSIALRSSPSVVLARLKPGRGPVSLPRGLVVVLTLVGPAGFPPSLLRTLLTCLAATAPGVPSPRGTAPRRRRRRRPWRAVLPSLCVPLLPGACAPETGPRPGFAPSWLGRCPN